MEINFGENPLIQNPNQVFHDSTLIGKGTKESPLKVDNSQFPLIIETTGTITGTDAVLVPCFPIPDTNAYFISGSVLVKCTDAGGGTIVVGSAGSKDYGQILVNNSSITGNDSDNQYDTPSMDNLDIDVTDVSSGQLRLTITPPSDTADGDSEFSYKIQLTGFSL